MAAMRAMPPGSLPAMRKRLPALLVCLIATLVIAGSTIVGAAEPAPVPVRIIGSGGSDDGQFAAASGIDVDSAGTIFVADYNDHEIEVFADDGTWIRAFGAFGDGAGELQNPAGVEVFHDTTVGRERVLVSEFGGARLHLFETSGTPVRSIATFAGASPTTLSFPLGLASAPDGRIAVADKNNDRVLILANDLTLVRQIDLSHEPRGVAFSPDGSIVHVHTANADIQSFATATGSPTGAFAVPGSGTHLHTDRIGFLYFAATVTGRGIYKYTPTGALQWSITSTGAIGFPHGSRPAPDGMLFVGEGQQVRQLNMCPDVFTDVAPGHPFFVEICWMASNDISRGYADGEYKSANPVSRQAMSAFLYRLAGEPAFLPPPAPTFSDVPTTADFFAEVEWMAAENISNGYGDGTYRPASAVTRLAMAAFMYRAAGAPSFTPPVNPTFSDVPTTHGFYDEIEWMAAEGISTGYSDGTYRPDWAVSRQAMSAFMARYSLLP